MATIWRFDLVSKKLSTHPVYRDDAYISVTSRPYPHDFSDSMDIVPSILSARFMFNPFWTDEMDVVPSIHGGDLRPQLQNYAWPAEGLDLTPEIISGDLRVLARFYNWPAEQMDVTPSIQSGDLRVTLRTYGNWPAEGLDVTPSIISGTLS